MLRGAAALLGAVTVYLAVIGASAPAAVRQLARRVGGVRPAGSGVHPTGTVSGRAADGIHPTGTGSGRAAAGSGGPKEPARPSPALGGAVAHWALLAGWSKARVARWRRWRLALTVMGGLAGLAVGGGWGPGGGPGGSGLVMAAAGAAAGWWLAVRGLMEAASRRQASLRDDLPVVLERYVLGASAGLTVRQALRVTADRSPGPMGRLLARIVQRLDLGADLGDAVAPELEGVEAGPVRLVLTAWTNAERLGSSLAETVEQQAAFVRRLAVYEAERVVDALPLKLTLCSIAFLFPPVFVVVLVPNLILFLRGQW